ncbi:hypothetical protein HHK36_030281 [Tetracentron sinense]|uniref:DhaK domain-containing protein n=1 Tax=Tetracentron sinense TaxID=13715 RepID=A0A834Y7B5_TETSI|nr:hypothetical protein HHK36_030281 [Tetracentron sinense]
MDRLPITLSLPSWSKDHTSGSRAKIPMAPRFLSAPQRLSRRRLSLPSLRVRIRTLKASSPSLGSLRGGSGHEPAHAGFVGEGMITAAICGDVFTSPPVDSILANYTGDWLNFGLAAEQAKSKGYKIEVAGAAAAAGLSLADVAAEAKLASEMVGTMGVALSVCTLPGQATSDCLGPGKMELGLGIAKYACLFRHREPGAAVVDLQRVDVIVSHVLKQILSPINSIARMLCHERSPL